MRKSKPTLGWATLPLVPLAIFLLIAAVTPLFVVEGSITTDVEHRLTGPSVLSWLGTDHLGRSLWFRILEGSLVSVGLALVASLMACALGGVTGAFCAWRGGWLDRFFLRVIDFFSIFPSVLTAILIMIYVGRGWIAIGIALSLTSWEAAARIARQTTHHLKTELYVDAAKCQGLTSLQLLVRHILPGMTAPLSVIFTYQVAQCMMSESFLSFLGLGIQPPQASLGTLASEGYRAIQSYPYLCVFPALALFFSLMSIQSFGDRLKEVLDPKAQLRYH